MRHRPAPLLLVAVLGLSLAGCAAGDRIMDRAGQAAERALNRQIDNRTNRAVNGAIDGAFAAGEDAVRCAFDDDACVRQATGRGENVVLVDRDGTPVDRNGNPVDADDVEGAIVRAPGSAGPPRPGVTNTGFDFEPGARTLFEDDFEGTRTGNVPGSIRFIKGEMDVVEDRGNKVLRVLRESMFGVPMGERPDLFTIEFDVYMEPNAALCITTTKIDEYSRLDGMRSCEQAVAWMDMTAFRIASGTGRVPHQTGFIAPDGSSSGTGAFGGYAPLAERYVPVRATMDGTYLKVYLDETRVVNIPNAQLAPGSELIFFVQRYSGSYAEETVYIDNLRVGSGGQETGYGALSTGGRVTARGILFESGSAQLTGSSTAELTQLLAALEDAPGLRVRIEGHTDASGGADTNRRLSQQRADAVAAWLTGRGVSPSRLEAVGMGEDQPIASNDTAAGREQNRRVEIVGL
ncbi:OmpA family protein [Rubrivirga sp. S365]|uniref:OmpA family protein n=1 Tax=Rubrivirga litoralis TaxID=3075598 RepID=A0ABU3BNX9_9BACT|nr:MULTISPECIES: OmpA family protein [unclassified Rubrivirga]MDT0630935.1 OmpA family protein [Rubrivirga sp. F394]MDT7856578.1 OmpA family protein [Rubrivirga sp. S365]